MKIYITAPFREGKNKEEIEKLCALINKAGFEDFCFIRDVENYQKVFHDSKELMVRAKEETLKCDVLFIDFSEKSTGRTIEAGIAYGAGKKIVVVKKAGKKLNDTAEGIADIIIEYEKIEDIVEPLSNYYKKNKNE